jgi:hypothetical protein
MLMRYQAALLPDARKVADAQRDCKSARTTGEARRLRVGMDQTYAILNSLADFGELVSVLPAALAVCAFLAIERSRRLALAWIGVILGAALVAASFKAVHAPLSGHAAVSVSFLGSLAVLIGRGAFGAGVATRVLAIVPAATAAAVCVVVWVLGWHHAVDIATGTMVGLVAPVTLWRMPFEGATRARQGAVALAAAAILVAAFHGIRFDDAVAYHAKQAVMAMLLGLRSAHAWVPL